MANFANGVDVFKIWADMMAFDKTDVPMDRPHHFCGFVGRRDSKTYARSHEQLLDELGDKLVIVERVQSALSGIMGDQMYVGIYETEEEMMDAFQKIME